MLNGLYPIIIINLKKLVPNLQAATSGIPLLSNLTNAVPLAPIPIYLDERRFGIYVDSESKNLDLRTEVETNVNGDNPKTSQSGIASTVTVQLLAKKDSVPLIIMLALADMIFPRCTSEEYSITYLNGSMSIFGGLVESFSATEDANTDLIRMTLQMSNAKSTKTIEAASPPALEKANDTQDITAAGRTS